MSVTDKVCFDRILPRDLRRMKPGRMIEMSIGSTRAAFQVAKLWQNGSAIRIRFVGGSSEQREMVRNFAPQWTEHANLHFEFGDAANSQVRIAFADDGAWSYIGQDALEIPADQPTMNFGWLDEGVILHEFGHMLGMIHEHQNPIDNPIVWNKPVVNAALAGPPNFWDQATIDHNIYATYAVNQINGSSLDPESVMLYSFPATWTENGFHSEPNETLSDIDRAFAARVYPRSSAPPGPVELQVVESAATEANIGQPGEEDLFVFTAAAAGRYTVETSGPTDLVMTLHGADGGLIDQDDDSGEGRNARLVVDLQAGSYTVQVRHYNSTGGTGNYAIRVSKG